MPRALRFILFVSVFSIFLYVANLVVYEAVALMWGLRGAWLIALGSALGVLSASFIAATMLGTRYYNFFTRAYYRVSAVWIGGFAYLFLASVAYGLAVGAAGRPLPWVGAACLAVAVAVSIYGYAHARSIRIAEVPVSLPNLPRAWEGRRLVWVSDVHLGQLHGPAFAARVVRAINSIPHDLVVIGGDLFDGTGAPDIDELAAPLSQLAAPLGVYFITGNHEEFGDSERFVRAVRAAGVRALINEKVELDGVAMLGVDYRAAQERGRFAGLLSQMSIDRARPSILFKHEPKDIDVAEAAGVSLQLSGHTHRGQ